MASNLVDPAIGSAGDVDSAMVTLRTRSGALCHISNSRRASYGYDQRIEVHGSQGMLRAGNPIPTTIEQADSAGYRHDPLMNFFLDRYSDAYRNELDAFIDALLGNGAMAPDGEDGLHALLLADAAARSAQEGRPVRL
jgi:myo-inositol 2-dehydrogenase/D-chiro-inositol 1-dehydrogenase